MSFCGNAFLVTWEPGLYNLFTIINVHYLTIICHYYNSSAIFVIDFSKVDDVNDLNAVGNIGEEPATTAPGNITKHTLEDFSDGWFYDTVILFYLKYFL